MSSRSLGSTMHGSTLPMQTSGSELCMVEASSSQLRHACLYANIATKKISNKSD